jgi:hypothetical protein
MYVMMDSVSVWQQKSIKILTCLPRGEKAPLETVMSHVRQFSSADGMGCSIQPKSGTISSPWPDHTHTFSRSMSLPAVQNSNLGSILGL